MTRASRLVLVKVVVLMAAACTTLRESPVVDGWPVGDALDCTTARARCPELLVEATAGLDRREPGHAPVVHATLHVEGGDPVAIDYGP